MEGFGVREHVPIELIFIDWFKEIRQMSIVNIL